MSARFAIGAAAAPELPAAWRRPLALLAGLALAILVAFRGDAADMAAIWWTSSTFNHCLLVLPILAWLVWQRREGLARLEPRSSPRGLAVVAAGAAAWLLGEAAGVALARHLGLVVMLEGAVVATFGIAVARALLFPLGYALFLVPVGEELVPALQTLTAELSMALLGLFGVPAHIEGVFITTPSGYFEVAEACSGVKFLIAMVALGVLAAHLCFRSWTRRAAFLAVCIVVPILANGVRAFGTIYIADRTGIAFAEDFDHVVYGWFFFAAVIAIVLAIGWRFFDRDIDEPAFDPARIQPRRPAPETAARRVAVTVAALCLALLPIAWSATALAAGRDEAPALALPPVPGWERTDAAPAHRWRARYTGADSRVEGRYRDAQGRIVDLAIAWYAWQDEGRELVGFGQGGVDTENEWAWTRDSASPEDGRAYRIVAPGPVAREVVQFHLVGDTLTGSDGRAKLATVRARLLGGDQRAVGVIVSAEGEGARAAIDAFLADAGRIRDLVDRAAAMPD